VQYLKNREELKIKSKERRIMKADGWPDRGRIDMIDLKCRYRKNLDLVLRGLTVTFQGGHKIGVVGRTGSGKSTIMLCLLRILEAADGKIVLDGRDISQLSLDDLRSKITIILQDPCLFAGTIREVFLSLCRTWIPFRNTPTSNSPAPCGCAPWMRLSASERVSRQRSPKTVRTCLWVSVNWSASPGPFSSLLR
jgi:hypothetical protein